MVKHRIASRTFIHRNITSVRHEGRWDMTLEELLENSAQYLSVTLFINRISVANV